MASTFRRPLRPQGSKLPTRQRNPPDVVLRGWQDTAAAWLGRVILLAAVWSLVGLLLRRFDEARRVDDLFGLVNLPVSPSLFSAVLLLGRRRRRASADARRAVAAARLPGTRGCLPGLRPRAHPGAGRGHPAPAGDDGRRADGQRRPDRRALVLLWRIRHAFSSRLEPGARLTAAAVARRRAGRVRGRVRRAHAAIPGHLAGPARTGSRGRSG